MREKITDCPLSSTCDCNCFDPIATTEECRSYYTPEESLKYLAFIYGFQMVLKTEEEQ